MVQSENRNYQENHWMLYHPNISAYILRDAVVNFDTLLEFSRKTVLLSESIF